MASIFQIYWKYLRNWGFSLEWKNQNDGVLTRQYTKIEKDRILVVRVCDADLDECSVTFRSMNPDDPQPNRWREKTIPIQYKNSKQLEQVIKEVINLPNTYNN